MTPSPSPPSFSPEHSTLVERMKRNLPQSYPVQKPDGEGTYLWTTYRGKRLCVVVPRDFKPTPRVPIIIHFHGLRNAGHATTYYQTVEFFDFPKILNLGAPNALLAFPVGDYENYTLDDDFASYENLVALDHFVRDAAGLNLAYGIVSGHSAAGRVIAPILRGMGPTQTFFKRALFFDALYSQWEVEDIRRWLNANHDRRVWVTAPKESGTFSRSSAVRAPGYTFEPSTVSNHWNLVRDKYFERFLRFAMEDAPDPVTGKEPKP